MPNRLVVCGIALLLTVSTAGCGSKEAAPKPDPKPSATAKPTAPPGLDKTAPARPAKQADAPESALEYGRYFARLVQYAIEVRSSRVLYAEAFNQSGCTNCSTVARLISELKRTGYWQRSEPVELGTFRAVAMQGGYRVSGSFIYPEVEDVTVENEVVKTVPAEPYRYYVDMKFDDKTSTWRVLDFIYGKKKG